MTLPKSAPASNAMTELVVSRSQLLPPGSLGGLREPPKASPG